MKKSLSRIPSVISLSYMPCIGYDTSESKRKAELLDNNVNATCLTNSSLISGMNSTKVSHNFLLIGQWLMAITHHRSLIKPFCNRTGANFTVACYWTDANMYCWHVDTSAGFTNMVFISKQFSLETFVLKGHLKNYNLISCNHRWLIS